MVLKIFFPQCCNRADSGLLVGRWIDGHDSAVVLAVVHYPFIPGQVKLYIQQMQAQSGVELTVLGSWSLPKDGQEGMESFLRDLSTIFPQERWLQISRETGKTGFSCDILDQNGVALQKVKKKEKSDGEEEADDEEEEEKVIFVHYEQRKVMLSQLHPVENGVPDSETAPPSELRQMFRTVARSQPLFFLDRYDDGPLKSTHWQSEGREGSIIVELLKQATVPLCLLVGWLLSLWTWFCNVRVFSLLPFRFLSSKLSSCVQLSYRTEHVRTLSSSRPAAGHTEFMRPKSLIHRLWFVSSASGKGAGGSAAVADGSSRRPEDEPGPGPGYIHLMSPFVERILWYGGLSACLGLTFALSLLSDMVALLTFHIYCFYVYGARLYCLKIYGLSSLWRLFRGKKWNVLRQRLFIGTLLFTVLLFLLPTTALYYLVFTLLRLVVVLVQGVVHLTVDFINSFPLFAVCLRICRPYRLAEGVKFRVLCEEPGTALHLLMEMNPLKCNTVVHTYRMPTYSCYPKDSWMGLVKKLFVGELVYPWRHKNTKTD
ncbi:hypothetical protein F2P81_015492 [Scophthalmus maximus]|uniref:Phosphatidylinositol N-acetylglucosaminyltransferase subunit Q n=1 Tax=Scophthalmus maximus TaxID=52904 RepID=A0A6A4SSW1_SCOMX|nr:hypothetical protein F2P81_015492 [Scophthalmus maximus]